MGKHWQAGSDRSELGERAYQRILAVEEVRLERDHIFGLLADADRKGGSLEAQEVVAEENSRSPIVVIPTVGVLMSDPAQADGILKVGIWCGEPPTVQMGVKGGQSSHQAGGGGGHWVSVGGAGMGHRTGGCARARAPESGILLTGVAQVKK